MEKGMAGDRAAGQMDAATASSTPTATIERGAEGRTTTPMETPRTKRRRAGGGGAPSGSISHPAREGDLPATTLLKDADGTWRISNDETGDSWTWDAAAEMWRGEGATEDISAKEAGGGPEEQAVWLSGEPNRPPDA